MPPTFSPTRSYETITKWSAQINLTSRIPESMRRAYTKLRSGRPGPVLLEIPSDVAGEEIADATLAYEPPPIVRSAADPEGIRRAASALLAAERPIIHAGQGVLYAEATDELVQLAEFLQAPVMTTLSGKSAFPEHHPLSVGTGSRATTGGVYHFLRRADLVLGHRLQLRQERLRRAHPQRVKPSSTPPTMPTISTRTSLSLPAGRRRQAGVNPALG